MPQFNRALDVYQGFNFRKDKVTNVGFITSLKIGTLALAADITAKDPMAPTTDLAVVSVMSDFGWGLGVTDALELSGQVCIPNKQSIASLLLSDLSNVTVEVQLTIYEYDPLAKKYFKSFCTDAVLKGIVEKHGGDLALVAADDPSQEVQSPKNFAFHISLKPEPLQQSITLATGDTKNIVKQWGITS
jgi:hypothetical protein